MRRVTAVRLAHAHIHTDLYTTTLLFCFFACGEFQRIRICIYEACTTRLWIEEKLGASVAHGPRSHNSSPTNAAATEMMCGSHTRLGSLARSLFIVDTQSGDALLPLLLCGGGTAPRTDGMVSWWLLSEIILHLATLSVFDGRGESANSNFTVTILLNAGAALRKYIKVSHIIVKLRFYDMTVMMKMKINFKATREFKYSAIVYYAPREEKTWTGHIEGEGGKHEMWVGQFYSRGAYTFFRHSKRKVTALRLHSRAYSRHFTHTMTKK